jgi:hypothetical protein
MMIIRDKLIDLYPELKDFDFSSGVITLENASDGQGDYIAEWNHPTLAKPTDEQLKGI